MRSVIENVEVQRAPAGCETYHETLLTNDAVRFIARLVRQFDADVTKVSEAMLCKYCTAFTQLFSAALVRRLVSSCV